MAKCHNNHPPNNKNQALSVLVFGDVLSSFLTKKTAFFAVRAPSRRCRSCLALDFPVSVGLLRRRRIAGKRCHPNGRTEIAAGSKGLEKYHNFWWFLEGRNPNSGKLSESEKLE